MATWYDSYNQNYANFLSYGHSNDTAYGFGGNDLIFGWKGNDYLDGGNKNDRLYGEQGNDQLLGGSGNDLLSGGSGYDELLGGRGSDQLWGGSGGDAFIFDLKDTGDGNAYSADTIGDFTNDDQIWLKGSYAYAGNTIAPRDGQYSIWNDGSDWVVTYNSSLDNGYHDIIVNGSNPIGDISFF